MKSKHMATTCLILFLHSGWLKKLFAWRIEKEITQHMHFGWKRRPADDSSESVSASYGLDYRKWSCHLHRFGMRIHNILSLLQLPAKGRLAKGQPTRSPPLGIRWTFPFDRFVACNYFPRFVAAITMVFRLRTWCISDPLTPSHPQHFFQD